MPAFGPIATMPIAALSAGGSAASAPLTILPDAALLHCGKRATYRWYVTDTAGRIVRATNGNTIRLGGSVSVGNGQIESYVVGDMAELTALNDDEWGGWDYPPASWTVT